MADAGWKLRCASDLDAWAVVPGEHEEQRRVEWRDAVANAVEARWHPSGDDGFSTGLRSVLDALLEHRPAGALCDLVAWPSPAPWPAQVTFMLADLDDAPDLHAQGYIASPYLEGPFGAGTQYTRHTPLEAEPEIEMIDSIIVFDRGDIALCVRIQPMPAAMYVLMLGEIAAMIEGCSLADENGEEFRAADGPYRLPGNDDAWVTGRDEREAADG